MNWVLSYTENEPIVLECTTERNIRFYESLGFKVVEEVSLTDSDETGKLWVMLRPGNLDEMNIDSHIDTSE